VEGVLSKDMAMFGEYLQTWKLKLSTTKAMSAAFHLNNKEAKRELKVNFNNETLPFCSNRIYLGVMLDRSLTHRRYLESLRKKLTSRVPLLRPGWGVGATTLRIATLALVHSTAEYCAPVWCRSAHTCLIDPDINDTSRIVTVCLRPTPTDNLPILAYIHLVDLCHNEATLSLGRRAMEPGQLLHSALTHPSSAHARHGSQMECGWANKPTRLRIFIPNTGTHHPGMTFPRRAWVWLNRLRTSVGRFHSCLYKWGMASSAACECGAEEQTVDHVVLVCLIHRSPLGLQGLTVLDDETTEWLLNTCPEI